MGNMVAGKYDIPYAKFCKKDFTLVKMNSYADITVIMMQNLLLMRNA